MLAKYSIQNYDKATATYSKIRTGILYLTPGDNKCRFYCKGPRCRFCVVPSRSQTVQAIQGLYSTWVTDNILAMARLQPRHFDEFSIIEQFIKNDIKSVFNLQQFGEHAFCGSGNLTSGFSYDPEALMRSGIYYYNFPLPDFEACSVDRLLDIVKVVDFAVSMGKVAIHCHAGHGRTGMVIAAWLMYSGGVSPARAVGLVRSRREAAVQSRDQVETLHKFMLLMQNDGGMIIDSKKYELITQYVAYNQKFISKAEARYYGNVPKIVYVTMNIILNKFYDRVSIDFQKVADTTSRFFVKCERPKKANSLLDEQLLKVQLIDDNLSNVKEWYQKLVDQGLTIATMKGFLEAEDFRDLFRFLDYFFQTSFHQLSFRSEMDSILRDEPQRERARDFAPTFWLLVRCASAMPTKLQSPMSILISRFVN
ncbi:unnamed protein product [Caenorhabditis bovis]|uniref:Tyrosine specific protein phosphatases domain-containing protein n=1 Tax=Caenorhabditis bovis TaxID=2654633 RepID=A0A8S1F2M4_9PELO|nr:unnamed protein product [Caenorhabditis bovis]